MKPAVRRNRSRFTFAGSIALVLILIPVVIAGMVTKNGMLFAAGLICAIPFLFIVVFGVLNLNAFPFDYGWFGVKTRTPIPKSWSQTATVYGSLRVGED